MTFLYDLSHGEIIVFSGLVALTMFTLGTLIGAVVAWLATREPAPEPVPGARPVAPAEPSTAAPGAVATVG